MRISFQEIQHNTALHSSLMFIPMVIMGAATNIFTGYMVDKVTVGILVFVSGVISTVSPLLMALVNPDWGYWRGSFVAMALSPVHADGPFSFPSLSPYYPFPIPPQANRR
jgi:hypothetical protein